jgi:hypothetical protein
MPSTTALLPHTDNAAKGPINPKEKEKSFSLNIDEEEEEFEEVASDLKGPVTDMITTKPTVDTFFHNHLLALNHPTEIAEKMMELINVFIFIFFLT